MIESGQVEHPMYWIPIGPDGGMATVSRDTYYLYKALETLIQKNRTFDQESTVSKDKEMV